MSIKRTGDVPCFQAQQPKVLRRECGLITPSISQETAALCTIRYAVEPVSYTHLGLHVNDDSGIAGTYAIDAISDALQKVSDQRYSLGAVQNRLEHTIDNLDNVVRCV